MPEIITNIITILLIIIGLVGFSICAIGIGNIIVFIQMKEYESSIEQKK